MNDLDHSGYWKTLGDITAAEVQRRGLLVSDDPDIRNLQLRSWLLHVISEICEAFEALRRLGMPDEIWYTRAPHENSTDYIQPEGVPIELADAVMAIASVATLTGIDLGAAIDEKLAYNRTRPVLTHKHF